MNWSNTWRCSYCSKITYPSRRSARQAMRRLFPDHRLSVYLCRHGGSGFHLGHNSFHPRPPVVEA